MTAAEDLILRPWAPETRGAITGPANWYAIFGRTAPLAVEIGPGKGVFLARIATEHPEWNFVAIELRAERARLCARKALAAKCRHVRLVEGPAEEIVPALFAPGSVSTWYINFPDPWPKRRHKKHRIVQTSFVEDLARLTSPEGVVYLATDDADYGDQILRVFETDPAWTNHYGPGRWGAEGGEFSRTIHEEKFQKWGRSIRYFRFLRTT